MNVSLKDLTNSKLSNQLNDLFIYLFIFSKDTPDNTNGLGKRIFVLLSNTNFTVPISNI